MFNDLFEKVNGIEESADKIVSVNEYGDLVCPHCSTNIITPMGFDVQPGQGTCPWCKKIFVVTEKAAEEANILNLDNKKRMSEDGNV